MLSTLFSYNLSLHSSIIVKDKFRTCRRKTKNYFIYILIFNFKYRMGSQQILNWFLLSFPLNFFIRVILNCCCLTHRLRVSENSVLRRIFGLKTYEIMGHWRKLHNKELHNLYVYQF
jgi:hypothetical protein